jgi:hypothetical protein
VEWDDASSRFHGEKRDRVKLALSRIASAKIFDQSSTTLLPGMPLCPARAITRTNTLHTPLRFYSRSKFTSLHSCFPQLPARVPPHRRTLYISMSGTKKQGTLKYVRSSQQTLGWEIYASLSCPLYQVANWFTASSLGNRAEATNPRRSSRSLPFLHPLRARRRKLRSQRRSKMRMRRWTTSRMARRVCNYLPTRHGFALFKHN